MAQDWWKSAVVYQIYPRSFMDSNGDGIGDLQGILGKLDYLQDLGVDVLWLSPIYDSPNDDNGYDIRDYKKIMSEFGTMEDFEQLLLQMHRRGLKLVMDLVVNHTSDEHPWFVESRSSIDSPYRNYYLWRKGKQGREPNNWLSYFSGPAWEYDSTTQEYYLHLFSRKQPDLNWDNPTVRQQVYDLMKFWLDKGIDGFRMDVINHISKVPGLPDGSHPNERGYAWGGEFFANGPRVHEYLQEMNHQVLSRYDVMTVGETGGVSPSDARLYAGFNRQELNMVFQFEHMNIDAGPGGKWDLKPWKLTDLKQVLSRWQQELHGTAWNSLYFGNHDQPRSVSRFGDDGLYRVESAKMLATCLMLQQGTPYIYQGEEIGMTNVDFPSIKDYRDVEIMNLWQEQVEQGGADPAKVLHAIHVKGRDNARTPMQWSADAHAAFTVGEPWIKLNPNYPQVNVAQAVADENSVYHYYKRLIRLRKQHPVLVDARYDLILPNHQEIYAYTRTMETEQWLVVCNFFAGQPEFVLPSGDFYQTTELVLSNYPVLDSAEVDRFNLRPYECRVYRRVQHV
ncbi:alpha-glucosidase [Alicyclobacillaceae bacterium I2511]|nr:alpha-glucosidase [Alicyclobacillaceae bacterium I2511]